MTLRPSFLRRSSSSAIAMCAAGNNSLLLNHNTSINGLKNNTDLENRQVQHVCHVMYKLV